MAIYEAATQIILPENKYQARINPTQLIVHTAVDNAGPSNLPGYFGKNEITLESHFWLPNRGHTGNTSGNIVQMMDTNVQADANYTANGRAISIETEDDGNPEANPWTAEQVGRLVALIQWANRTHNIPMRLCETHDSPGVGWHSMFGFEDPINQIGPIRNPWSIHRGKTCPGKTRIRQLVDVVLPAANSAPVAMMMVRQEDMAQAILSSFRRDVRDLYVKYRNMADPAVAARVAADIESWVEAVRRDGKYREHLEWIAATLEGEKLKAAQQFATTPLFGQV